MFSEKSKIHLNSEFALSPGENEPSTGGATHFGALRGAWAADAGVYVISRPESTTSTKKFGRNCRRTRPRSILGGRVPPPPSPPQATNGTLPARDGAWGPPARPEARWEQVGERLAKLWRGRGRASRSSEGFSSIFVVKIQHHPTPPHLGRAAWRRAARTYRPEGAGFRGRYVWWARARGLGLLGHRETSDRRW